MKVADADCFWRTASFPDAIECQPARHVPLPYCRSTTSPYYPFQTAIVPRPPLDLVVLILLLFFMIITDRPLVVVVVAVVAFLVDHSVGEFSQAQRTTISAEAWRSSSTVLSQDSDLSPSLEVY